MWWKSSEGYVPIRPLAQNYSVSDEDEDKTTTQTPEATGGPFSRFMVIAIALNVFLLCGSLLSLSFAIYYYHPFGVLNPHLRQASAWSPLYDLVDLRPQTMMVNGTLFPPKDPSIARQLPNPNADMLWEEYELIRVFPVTKADVVKLGKDPSTAVKLEDEIWGLGDDAYATVLDVYHQIHCLNSLRQIAYGSYYNRSQGRADTLLLREMHINHCTDILLQALQCSGNLNLITMHWVETQLQPWPDMSLNKQCVDFPHLTEWRKEATIDMDKFAKIMVKPDGITQLHAPDQYYEHFGGKNPNHPNDTHSEDDFIL
ncbi:hypothetical protein BJ170DRAFT_684396 [Xylariales sp. AK1849]|nr:hypothetical protein BJ170DRAFT_684396 [Xylariales sp. AK1849]